MSISLKNLWTDNGKTYREAIKIQPRDYMYIDYDNLSKREEQIYVQGGEDNYTEAYDEGFHDGREEGYEDGYNSGCDN